MKKILYCFCWSFDLLVGLVDRVFPYQYLKNTAEHTSDLVCRFPELSTSTHFLKFTVKYVFLQSNWEHHKEVKAAQGVKIIAKELEKSLAGLPMYVAKRDDEVEYYKVQREHFGFNVIGFRF